MKLDADQCLILGQHFQAHGAAVVNYEAQRSADTGVDKDALHRQVTLSTQYARTMSAKASALDADDAQQSFDQISATVRDATAAVTVLTAEVASWSKTAKILAGVISLADAIVTNKPGDVIKAIATTASAVSSGKPSPTTRAVRKRSGRTSRPQAN